MVAGCDFWRRVITPLRGLTRTALANRGREDIPCVSTACRRDRRAGRSRHRIRPDHPIAKRQHREPGHARNRQSIRPDRQAPCRDQLRQRGVGAEVGPRAAAEGITPDTRCGGLAKRLNVALEFVPYEAAGKVFEGAQGRRWDIGFIAIEPVRAADIDFTATLRDHRRHLHGAQGFAAEGRSADVDKAGTRIAVGRGSAYDLYLTRTIKNAHRSSAPRSAAARR